MVWTLESVIKAFEDQEGHICYQVTLLGLNFHIGAQTVRMTVWIYSEITSQWYQTRCRRLSTSWGSCSRLLGIFNDQLCPRAKCCISVPGKILLYIGSQGRPLAFEEWTSFRYISKAKCFSPLRTDLEW